MSELSRAQVEQLPGRLTEIHFDVMWQFVLDTDAALRARHDTDQLCIKAQADELGRLRARLEASEVLSASRMNALQGVSTQLNEYTARLEAVERDYEAAQHLADVTGGAWKLCKHDVDVAREQLAKVEQERNRWMEEKPLSGVIVKLEQQLAAAEGRVRELVKFYDDHHGTPCEQIRHAQELDTLTTRLATVEAAASKFAEYIKAHIPECWAGPNPDATEQEAVAFLQPPPPREAGR